MHRMATRQDGSLNIGKTSSRGDIGPASPSWFSSRFCGQEEGLTSAPRSESVVNECNRDFSPATNLVSNFRVADHPIRNGPIWYERSTNMRRHEDWILVGVTAVFRQ